MHEVHARKKSAMVKIITDIKYNLNISSLLFTPVSYKTYFRYFEELFF